MQLSLNWMREKRVINNNAFMLFFIFACVVTFAHALYFFMWMQTTTWVLSFQPEGFFWCYL